MDVSDEASVVEGMQKIADTFGSIDICVANAGIAEGQNIRNSSLEFWRNIMAINLDGTYLTVRESLRYMPVKDWGTGDCRFLHSRGARPQRRTRL